MKWLLILGAVSCDFYKCLQTYFLYLCRTPLDLDSAPNFDTYGLALGCPEPVTPGQPLDFSLFGERITGPSWLLTRFEAIQD